MKILTIKPDLIRYTLLCVPSDMRGTIHIDKLYEFATYSLPIFKLIHTSTRSQIKKLIINDLPEYTVLTRPLTLCN